MMSLDNDYKPETDEKKSREGHEQKPEEAKEFDIRQELTKLLEEEKFKEAGTYELVKGLMDKAEKFDRPEKIKEAVRLMVELHADQKDRPQEPYLNHTSNVANRLINEYQVVDTDIVIAGALHDSVEDQAGQLVDIYDEQELEGETEHDKALSALKDKFGEKVSYLVGSLSNPEIPDDISREEKNRLYMEHVSETIQDPEVALIKLSDFSENALRLEEIDDLKVKKKLTIKYLPVVQLFIERLQSDDISIPAETKENVLSKLDKTVQSMQQFLENRDTVEL